MSRIGNARYQLSSRLAGLPTDLGWALGLTRSYYKNARGARILVYHGVCRKDPFRFNTLFVKIKTLEAQLRLYKKYFNLVSLDDFYQQKFSSERFNLCLSFDDGFANNYKYVWPLLEEYQVPAVFFVPCVRQAGFDILWNDILSIAYLHGPEKIVFKGEEFLKGRDRRYRSSISYNLLADEAKTSGFEDKARLIRLLSSAKHKADVDYWLQMTTEELKEMSESRWVTIGGHSRYHDDLAKISMVQAKEDICASKGLLEHITGKEVKALAFPYGSYTKELLSEARNAGYSQLLATDIIFPDDKDDGLLNGRLTVNPFVSNINQLHANITGNY